MVDDSNHGMTLRDALEISFLEKRKILTVYVLTVLTALVGVYVWPTSYVSEAKVLIKMGRETGSPSPTVLRPSQMLLTRSQSIINTEVQMLRSDRLIAEVVDKIGVDTLTHVDPPRTFLQRLRHVAKLPLRIGSDAVNWFLDKIQLRPRLPLRNAVIEAIHSGLSCDPAQDSDILVVRLRWSDPGTAAQILDELLSAYMALHLDAHSDPRAYELFREQMAALKRELGSAESTLAQQKKEWQISALGPQRELLLGQLSDVQARIDRVHEDRASLEAEIEALASQQGAQRIIELDALERNPVVDEISSEIAALEAERDRLRLNYVSESERLQQLEERLKSARERLRRETAYTLEVAMTAMERRSRASEARLQELGATASGLRAGLAELDRREAAFRDATEHIERLRESIALYDRRAEEARIHGIMDAENITDVTVVDPASVPVVPSSPRRILTIGVALVLGPLVGLAFGLGARFLDRSIIRPAQVEEAGMRLLSVVPLQEGRSRPEAGGSRLTKLSVWQVVVGLPRPRK